MATKKTAAEQDLSKTYNEFKNFEGRRYTGMKVGGHHKWYYRKGEWKERKVAPDRWEFTYAVPKRRAGHAPPGSGVPVGTEYHWFIVAHQNVRKLDENTYSTAMTGLKFKVAHKRADKETWSASDAAQRRRLIEILREMIAELSLGYSEEVRPSRRRSSRAAPSEREVPAARRFHSRARISRP
jgi:hypothetical protein